MSHPSEHDSGTERDECTYSDLGKGSERKRDCFPVSAGSERSTGESTRLTGSERDGGAKAAERSGGSSHLR